MRHAACKLSFLANATETSEVTFRKQLVVRNIKMLFFVGFDSRTRAICGFSLLLVIVLALNPKGFSRILRFPPSTKTYTSKFQFNRIPGGTVLFNSRKNLLFYPRKRKFIYLHLFYFYYFTRVVLFVAEIITLHKFSLRKIKQKKQVNSSKTNFNDE